MKGNPKSWRSGSPSREAKKLELMRRAKSEAENNYGIGGVLKKKNLQRKPVTLVKMPWNK